MNTASNESGGAPGAASGATILVVDDEQGPRESLRMILSPQHRVLQAGDGKQALRALHAERVDLVTLDLNMPGMKGGELMGVVRREFPEVEVIVITGCGSVESATDGIRHGICDYLLKPFDVVQVTGAVTRALDRGRARRRLVGFLEELGTVVGRDREALALLDDVRSCHRLRGRLAGLLDARSAGERPTTPDLAHNLGFLEVLAETIETKDRFMRGHARRVAFYASVLAERLGLDPEPREQIRIAAFLHDLGKVGIPTELLLRPGGLEADERTLIETHPEIGVRLVKPLDLPGPIVEAIRHHHEWWDGSGYPAALDGESIPLAARIIAVADAFDAMSSDRPYRPALRRDVVTKELRRFAGRQFDPHLAKEFLGILETRSEEVDLLLVADALSRSSAAPRTAGT